MAHLESHKNGPDRDCSRQALLTAAAATAVMALGFGAMALTSVFIAPLEKEFGWSRSEISLGYTVATGRRGCSPFRRCSASVSPAT